MAPKLQLVTQKNLGYFTGTSAANGTQCVMGFISPGLVVVQFTLSGELIGASEREFNREMWDELTRSPVWHEGLDPVPQPFQWLRQLQEQLAFREGPVQVHPFTLEPSYPITLDIVSGMTRHMIKHPDEFASDEVREAHQEIAAWDEECDHAFTWNEEVMLAPDGRIEST